jgi:hypothetical protein
VTESGAESSESIRDSAAALDADTFRVLPRLAPRGPVSSPRHSPQLIPAEVADPSLRPLSLVNAVTQAKRLRPRDPDSSPVDRPLRLPPEQAGTMCRRQLLGASWPLSRAVASLERFKLGRTNRKLVVWNNLGHASTAALTRSARAAAG